MISRKWMVVVTAVIFVTVTAALIWWDFGSDSTVPGTAVATNSPAAMAGLVPTSVDGPLENVSLGPQPTGEWIALVQAPFAEGATILLDWKDENNFVQLRPRVGFAHWTVDRVVDGAEQRLQKLALSTAQPLTLFVRRSDTSLQIEFKRSLRMDVPLDNSAPPEAKVGIGWYGLAGDIPIFELGSADVPPGADAGFLPTKAEGAPSAFSVGPGQYRLGWLAGDENTSNALIYTPVGPPGTRYPVAVITPGYLGRWDTTTWLAPQLASRGYLVAAVQTSDPTARPEPRGDDIVDVIDRTLADESLAPLIDTDRIALIGHSMGAGASLDVASRDDRVASVVAMAPWIDQETTLDISVPALVFSCATDSIASYDEHTRPVLDNLSSAPATVWLEFEGVGHVCPTNQLIDLPIRSTIVDATIAFLAYSLDNDVKASSGLCRTIADAAVLSRSDSQCA